MGLFACAESLFAHPHGPNDLVTHEHPALGLIISIENDRVVYDVSLANGFLNMVVPRERGFLKLHLEENTFVFEDPAQEQYERDALKEFVGQLPAIEINGKSIGPEFDSFSFVRSSASANKEESDKLPPDARVRVVFPSPEVPKHAALAWDVFADAYSVDAFGRPIKPTLAARLDTRDQSRIIRFSQDEPTVTWRHQTRVSDHRVVEFRPEYHRSIPLLAILILVAGLGALLAVRKSNLTRRVQFTVLASIVAVAILCKNMGTIELGDVRTTLWARSPETFAKSTLDSLLGNIYRAFEYRQESDVYDVLAQSVDGPLLDEVYREIYNTLIAPSQGGAVTKVESFEMISADLIEPLRREGMEFEIAGRWQVDGMVYHWGHVHDTSSIFEAIYTVAPRDGFWKIIKTEMKSANPET